MAQAQRTLLQIIQTVEQELGLPVSATVIGNTDLTTVQLLALANLCNEELRDSNDDGWTVCTKELNLIVNPPITVTGNSTTNSPVITGILPNTTGLSAYNWYVSGPNLPQGARILSVDSSSQVTLTMEVTTGGNAGTFVFAQDTYAMPSDMDFFVNRTSWDRTNRWELLGPDSNQLDQWHRSGIIATGPRRHFRTLGPFANNYRLWPPPSEIIAPIQIAFEYVSLNIVAVQGSQTNFAILFANDTDQPLIDDRALIMGIKWRFWEQKGLNYASKRDEYDRYVERLMARDDAGSPTLSMVQRVNPIFLSPSNVQDGFYPGPVGPNVA